MNAHPHTADAVLMVRPAAFGFDPATAATNTFQVPPNDTQQAIQAQAIVEFNAATQQLRTHGITVIVANDTLHPRTPDAIFSNNWLTTWPDGQIFTYPMHAPNRRLERRPAILNKLRTHYTIKKVTPLTQPESQDKFLEGTGAMVFDHTTKTVYACLSPRCDEQLLQEHAGLLGYTVITFHAVDEQGTPIYHTNVLMAVHGRTAVVCLKAIVDPAERHRVVHRLAQSDHTIVDITLNQLRHFAGNTLELRNNTGKYFIVMSQNAHGALTDQQRAQLTKDKAAIVCTIPTIEQVGGGSIRCMLTEIFLPRA